MDGLLSAMKLILLNAEDNAEYAVGAKRWVPVHRWKWVQDVP